MNAIHPWRSLALAGIGVLALAAPLHAAPSAQAAWTAVGAAGKLAIDDGGPRGGSTLPPVLFVHSYAGSSAHWKSALEHLRRTRRAVAFDFRGHGRSAAPPDNQTGEWAIDRIAADVGAVADALGLGRFVIVGHSMGGSIAASYAGRHPDRVAGLVVVGTPGKAPPEMAAQVLEGLRADYDKAMGAYWQSLLKNAKPATKKGREAEMKRLSKEQSMALIEATFAFDPLPAIGRYPGPKLIIDTEGGESAAALHEQLPQVERRLIPRTSHWVQLDDPKAFEDVLDQFLAKVG